MNNPTDTYFASVDLPNDVRRDPLLLAREVTEWLQIEFPDTELLMSVGLEDARRDGTATEVLESLDGHKPSYIRWVSIMTNHGVHPVGSYVDVSVAYHEELGYQEGEIRVYAYVKVEGRPQRDVLGTKTMLQRKFDAGWAILLEAEPSLTEEPADVSSSKSERRDWFRGMSANAIGGIVTAAVLAVGGIVFAAVRGWF